MITKSIEIGFTEAENERAHQSLGERSCVQIFKSKYFNLHFDLVEGQNTKILSKYQNTFLASKYQNIGCIDADFNEKGGIFLHFSRSARKISRKRLKTSEIAKNLRTKFLKIFEISQNLAKSCYFS